MLDIIKAKYPEAVTVIGNKVFDKNNKEITVVDIELLRSISKKNDLISESFRNDISSGFKTVSGITMQATINDMFLLDEGIKYIESLSVSNIDITDIDNKDHNVSITEAKNILQELKDNYYSLRSKKRTLQNSAVNSVSIIEVESISW